MECRIPEQIIEIELNGDIYLCGCSVFLPTVVGNILEIDSFDDVHNLDISKKIIHSTTVSKTFEYCQRKTDSPNALMCSHSIDYENNNPKIINVFNAINSESDLPSIVRKNIIESGGKFIVIGYDDSCNLECSSCRLFSRSSYSKTYGNVLKFTQHTSMREHIQKVASIHGKNVALNELRTSFKKEKEDVPDFRKDLINLLDEKVVHLINTYEKPACIEFGATGDAFFSGSVRNCISKLNYNPLHSYSFKTNGLSMKAVIPRLAIKDQIISLMISVDAATKETHEKLRCGSDWKTLMNNIEWVMSLPNRPFIECNFVIQKENYHEILEFHKLFLDTIGVDLVSFQPLRHPPHWTKEEYLQKNVSSHLHPEYKKYVETIKSIDTIKYHYVRSNIESMVLNA